MVFAILMVQKELAERILATPGLRSWGSLSVFMRYNFQVSKIHAVSRNCFRPVPKVDSTIIKLVPHLAPPITLRDEQLFFRLVKAIFWGRRKTLRAVLQQHPAWRLSATQADELLAISGLNPLTRGEKLDLATLAKLANMAYPLSP